MVCDFTASLLQHDPASSKPQHTQVQPTSISEALPIVCLPTIAHQATSHSFCFALGNRVYWKANNYFLLDFLGPFKTADVERLGVSFNLKNLKRPLKKKPSPLSFSKALRHTEEQDAALCRMLLHQRR